MRVHGHQVFFRKLSKGQRHAFLRCWQTAGPAPGSAQFNAKAAFFEHLLHSRPRDAVCIETRPDHEFAFPDPLGKAQVIQPVLQVVSEIDLVRSDAARLEYAPHSLNCLGKLAHANVFEDRIGEEKINALIGNRFQGLKAVG